MPHDGNPAYGCHYDGYPKVEIILRPTSGHRHDYFLSSSRVDLESPDLHRVSNKDAKAITSALAQNGDNGGVNILASTSECEDSPCSESSSREDC